MSNKEEAMRWLIQGERDLGAAMVLMDKEFYETREDADKCIKYAESILAEVRNFLRK